MQRLRPCGQEVNILQFQITNVYVKNLHENPAIQVKVKSLKH